MRLYCSFSWFLGKPSHHTLALLMCLRSVSTYVYRALFHVLEQKSKNISGLENIVSNLQKLTYSQTKAVHCRKGLEGLAFGKPFAVW